MTSIELTAPGKVNLFLKVLNKRKDDYHNILTLYERISLADVIKISKIPEGIIVSSDKFITADPKDNLVYKAAHLVIKASRLKAGVRIEITKRIPIAAGLGGGSSDAASVLLGMRKLFALKLDDEDLRHLARGLGADVSFFLLGSGFATAHSRGDRLNSVSSKTRLWHVIVYPGFKMSTKEAYEAFDTTQSPKHPTLRQGSGSSGELLPKHLTRTADDVRIMPSLNNSMSFETLEAMLHNDLEDASITKEGLIGKIVKRLAAGLGKKVIVSGSGPSVFCLCRTGKEAREVKKKLLSSVPADFRKGWQIFIARTEG